MLRAVQDLQSFEEIQHHRLLLRRRQRIPSFAPQRHNPHQKTPLVKFQPLGLGLIPIPTPKNKEQVEDYMQSLGWRLKEKDERALDEVGLTNAKDWKIAKHFQNC